MPTLNDIAGAFACFYFGFLGGVAVFYFTFLYGRGGRR